MSIHPTRRRFTVAEHHQMAVDLDQEPVSVYRDPTARGYRAVQVLRRGESVASASFPDQPLTVDDILG